MNQMKNVPAAIITIFGAKGDLTRRKLILALYNLFTAKQLPAIFYIYCIDYFYLRKMQLTKAIIFAGVNEFSRNGVADEKQWNAFAANLFLFAG